MHGGHVLDGSLRKLQDGNGAGLRLGRDLHGEERLLLGAHVSELRYGDGLCVGRELHGGNVRNPELRQLHGIARLLVG